MFVPPAPNLFAEIQCDVLGGGDFGGYLDHEGAAPMNGIAAVMKDARELRGPSHHVRPKPQ